MADFDLKRRLAAEALGTAFLVAAVVGSGTGFVERFQAGACSGVSTGAARDSAHEAVTGFPTYITAYGHFCETNPIQLPDRSSHARPPAAR